MAKNMKILIIAENQNNKYNWGHQLFRNEIARQHDVVWYGPGFVDTNISLFKYLKKIKMSIYDFDFVFTHGLKYTRRINDIWNIPKDVKKVHYVVDFFQNKGNFKGRELEQYQFINSYKPNIVFSVYHNSIELLRHNTICDNIYVLPFSVCTKTYFKKNNIKKKNYIMACFSKRPDAYPNRNIVLKILNKNNLRYITGKQRYDYINAINQCKISIGVCDIFKSLNMRVTEILSCGGFFLTDKPNYIERIGLINNEHYVIYNNHDDMIDKINYYFNNDKERSVIENNGMNFVRKYHSCKTRVKQMIKIINKVY